ncbi:MAG: hypothetical protein ACO3JL_00420 [Myxococcota bacterium]
MSEIPSVPSVSFEEEFAPLGPGELLGFAVPQGRAVTLRFPSAFELFLTLDDRRVTDHDDASERQLMLWAHRRLPLLYRALGETLGLRAVLTPEDVVVVDVVVLANGESYDHMRVRSLLSGVDVALTPVATLGSDLELDALHERLRSLYVTGTVVEVRREGNGQVLSRRRLRVAR